MDLNQTNQQNTGKAQVQPTGQPVGQTQQVATPVAPQSPVAPVSQVSATTQSTVEGQNLAAQSEDKPVQLEQTVEQAQHGPAHTQAPIDERPTEIKIVIPTQAYFISGIRDFVVNLTKNMTGFSEQWAYRFQAVVDELCNNAIEHGSKVGEMINITLISDKNKSLEVIVEDTGTGKEKMTAQQMKALFAKRKQMMTGQYLGFRGRGLPKIVGEWTDEVVFEDRQEGGLRVKVKKYLRKEEDKVSSEKQNDPTHLVIK